MKLLETASNCLHRGANWYSMKGHILNLQGSDNKVMEAGMKVPIKVQGQNV